MSCSPEAHRLRKTGSVKKVLLVGLAGALALAACGDDNPSSSTPAAITLVAYDSFPTKDTPLNTALAAFTADTGIMVNIGFIVTENPRPKPMPA